MILKPFLREGAILLLVTFMHTISKDGVPRKICPDCASCGCGCD